MGNQVSCLFMDFHQIKKHGYQLLRSVKKSSLSHFSLIYQRYTIQFVSIILTLFSSIFGENNKGSVTFTILYIHIEYS
jgi:hypothetical protein